MREILLASIAYLHMSVRIYRTMHDERIPSLRHLDVLRAVVRHGGVHAAARSLRLAPSTVSSHLAGLQRSLGAALVRRRGRGLEPTEAGRAVAAAADEVAAAASRLLAAVGEAGPEVLPVGVAEDVPQSVAHAVFAPAVDARGGRTLRLVVDRPERLFDDLAGGGLAAVLADRAPPPDLDPHARVHRLGSGAVAFLAPPALARRHARGFPAGLDGAPFILPAPGDALRRRLDQWFEEAGAAPLVAVETDDPELRLRFARAGAGILCAPARVAGGGLAVIGHAHGVEERWWLATRRASRDPGMQAVLAAARGLRA